MKHTKPLLRRFLCLLCFVCGLSVVFIAIEPRTISHSREVPRPIDETITLDFDAPDFAAGSSVGQIGDISFGPAATVFTPTRVATFSGTQALKVSATCATPECTNGAYRMGIRFGQPLPGGAWLPRRAESVSMRIGADAIASFCFPETSCPIYARLRGFDDRNNPVADSFDVFLLDASSLVNNGAYSAPITREISIRDPLARIVSVTLVYGKDTFNHDFQPMFPGEPQIDHLVVKFTDRVAQPVPTPAAPVIRIHEPISGGQAFVPYRVRLRGSITAAGGLAAFCYRVNAPVPISDDCRNNTDLRSDNTFDIDVPDSLLGKGANTLAVTVYDFYGQRSTQSVTITTVPPPPPVITIYTPTNNQWIDPASNLSLTGTVGTIGALKGFCVRIDATTVPAPGTCVQDLGAIKTMNTAWQPLFFTTPLMPSRLTTGGHQISVFAVDRWDQMSRKDVNVSTPTDFRIVGMEINQGVQTFDIPLNISGVAPYNGVNLRAGVPTVVRVFANTPFAGSYSGTRMLLNGFVPDPRLGERQIGARLPDSSPATLTTGSLGVPPSMRADPNGAFVFTLPVEWTRQNGLRLQAKLLLPFGAQECPTCATNNEFSVVSINFGPAIAVKIAPVALTFTDPIAGTLQPPPPPEDVLDWAFTISPMARASATVLPYVGTIDVSDLVGPGGTCRTWTTICESRIYSRMRIFHSQNPQDAYWLGLGRVDVGYTATPIAIADTRQPKIAAAHEFYHTLGYFHASPCGTNANLYIMWPPDQKGFIHGVGLDRRQNLLDSSGAWSGRYTILMPGTAGTASGPTDYYDLMSYCATETNAWISVENWNSFGGPFPNGLFPDGFLYGDTTATVRSMLTAQTQNPVETREDSLLVQATLDKNGRAQILRVAPAGNEVLRRPIKSAYEFVVRDSRRAEIARVPSIVQLASGRGEPAERLVLLTAIVPAKDAASIEVQYEAKAIGEIHRSKSPPSLTLPYMDQGAYASRDKPLDLTWVAKDGDNDPLEVRIEFSPARDKPFRTLFVGPNRGSWSVPGRLLSATKEGRLRIVANDGFNESERIIERITVAPAPPALEILAPAAGMIFPDTTPIRLRAAAFGDADAPLSGDQIRWSLDGRTIGTGVEVEVLDLKPGKHVASVTASDGRLTSRREVAFIVRASDRKYD